MNYLRATASYTDPEGSDTAMSDPGETGFMAVEIDDTNRAPKFPDLDDKMDGDQTDQEREIAENAVAGMPIGATVTATDSNMDSLTYSLGGTDGASFSIVRNTGQLQTKASLNREEKDTYLVTVTATDPSGLSATVNVTINITDVPEPPVIMRAPDANVAPVFASATTSRTVAENTAAGEDIGNPVAASDANGDTLTYALGGADTASFDIDTTSGQLMTLATLDYETKATYSVMVTASDSGGLSDSIDVTITVTDVDEDGTVTLSSETRVGTAITATLTDADGGVTGTTWQWAKATAMDGTYSDIAGATSDSYTPVEGDANMYLRATAMYTDVHGSGKSEMAVSDNAVAVNTAPAFDADIATRSVAENMVAGEDIGEPVMATDADDDTLTYTLSGTDASSFTIDESTGQLMTMADLDYETKTTYRVTVTATDTSEATDSVMVTITVTDVDENVAPEFADSEDGVRSVAENMVAGEDIGEPVMATDADDDTLTYTLSGTDASSFTIDESTGQLMTMADLDYETKTTYRVTVTATDTSEATDSVMVTITVTDVDENVAPEFADSEDGVRSVAENMVAGEDIGEPVMATDADDDTLTYTLSGTDASSFTIDESTGQLMTMADLDYETKTTYRVTVTATDTSEATDSVMVTITVTDVDENVAPEFADSEDGVRSVAENMVAGEDIGEPVMATDADDDTLTYTLSGTDASSFTIDESTGQLMTMADLDYETKTTYRVTVTATDTSEATDSVMVTITVTDVDENVAPEFADSEDGVRSVAENMVAGEDIGEPVMATDADDDTLTYTLSGTDASSFTIDESTGQLMTMADLDYETKTTYRVTVTATDTSEATDSVMVTITVTDVDENGTVGLSTQRPRVGTAITATLTDADGGVTGTTWQWAKATAMDGTYSDIAGATSDSYTPVEGDANMYLRATAMYTDVHGSGKSESMVSASAVNTVPAFDAGTATRSVDENTAAGENIGGPVMATDDADDMLTYTLSGTDESSFDIDELTGQLMTMADLDYETETTYIVTVTATDTSEATDSVMVTITVTNVDEAGTVTLSSETKVGVAITATLVDVDGGTTGTTWQWASSDAMDGTYTNIEGATSESYTPVEGDANMYLRATAMYTDGHGSGKSESMVSASAVIPTTGNPVADEYDANEDGKIDRAEVGQAVRAFTGRQIEHDDVVQIIAQYFKDLRSGS